MSRAEKRKREKKKGKEEKERRKEKNERKGDSNGVLYLQIFQSPKRRAATSPFERARFEKRSNGPPRRKATRARARITQRFDALISTNMRLRGNYCPRSRYDQSLIRDWHQTQHGNEVNGNNYRDWYRSYANNNRRERSAGLRSRIIYNTTRRVPFHDGRVFFASSRSTETAKPTEAVPTTFSTSKHRLARA